MHQLSVYHSLLTHKVMQAKAPKYLYNKFNTNYFYKTRQAASGKIRSTRTPELDLARDSFSWRATEFYNKLPTEIRSIETLSTEATRVWIKEKVDLI